MAGDGAGAGSPRLPSRWPRASPRSLLFVNKRVCFAVILCAGPGLIRWKSVIHLGSQESLFSLSVLARERTWQISTKIKKIYIKCLLVSTRLSK